MIKQNFLLLVYKCIHLHVIGLLITCKFIHFYHAFYAFILKKYNHKYMCPWFKMIEMITFTIKRIFSIFRDLITFYENFMTLIYQENNL